MTSNENISQSQQDWQQQIDEMLVKLAEDGDFDIEIPDDPPPENREGLENLEFHEGWLDEHAKFSWD